MTKYFCDGCDKEITEANSIGQGERRIKAKIQNKDARLSIEIVTGKDGTWNAGLFCKYCVLDALYKLDDRPKATDREHELRDEITRLQGMLMRNAGVPS